MIGIQVYSNRRPCSFPRGDNNEIHKKNYLKKTKKKLQKSSTNFKKESSSPESPGSISTLFGTKHSWV